MKDDHGRAGHHDVASVSVPSYFQHTAACANGNRRIQKTLPNTGHDSSTGAGTTGQCFTSASFIDAQPDSVPVDDFHETDVHPVWKTGGDFR